MKLNQDSITVNMVVKVKTNKYCIGTKEEQAVAEYIPETSIVNIQRLIDSGDFTAEYIPAMFTSRSIGTLIITEKN